MHGLAHARHAKRPIDGGCIATEHAADFEQAHAWRLASEVVAQRVHQAADQAGAHHRQRAGDRVQHADRVRVARQLVFPARFDEAEVDYLSNTIDPTYPDGLDIEVVATKAFNQLGIGGLSRAEMEHVTYGLYSRVGQFRIQNFANSEDLSHLRWTVDYEEDLDFVRQVFAHFKGRETSFTFPELLNYLIDNPELKSRIDGSRRNESLISMLKEGDSLNE